MRKLLLSPCFRGGCWRCALQERCSPLLSETEHQSRLRTVLPPHAIISRHEDDASTSDGGMWIAWALGLTAVLIQMFTNEHYGYFHDEVRFGS